MPANQPSEVSCPGSWCFRTLSLSCSPLLPLCHHPSFFFYSYHFQRPINYNRHFHSANISIFNNNNNVNNDNILNLCSALCIICTLLCEKLLWYLMHCKTSQIVQGAWNPQLSWTTLRILRAASLSHCPLLQSSERSAGTIARISAQACSPNKMPQRSLRGPQ